MPIEACTLQVVADHSKYILAGVSLLVAVIAIVALKTLMLSTKKKIGLIYLHLFSIFFPLSLFTTNAACGFLCLPCFEHPVGLAILALPSAVLFSSVVGFIVIPLYFFTSSKTVEVQDKEITTFVKKNARMLALTPPKVYAVSNAKPFAFSFRSFKSAIVLSVGLMDILRKKELEAVLLHELAHLQHKASAFKLSAFLMRFSPFWIFKTFSKELDEEEARADCVVCSVQGTHKYLEGARIKIITYNKTHQKPYLQFMW